jgi:hypothetical protein
MWAKLVIAALLISLAGLLAASCNGRQLKGDAPGGTETRLVGIGYIGATDDSVRQTITRLLRERGIRVSFSGSVVYGITVDERSALKAQEILKASPELRGKRVNYFDLSNHPK